ncbi:protein maelstrom [Biomphalaria glabrata]|nr:putative protein maelstrom [Biomphalaria glabrata]
MSSKKRPNGFYMFMLEEQQNIYRNTKRKPSMKEMPDLCYAKWLSLSNNEREMYEAQAKREPTNYGKQDCLRQFIAGRANPALDDLTRRRQEIKMLQGLLQPANKKSTELRTTKFLLVDFQVMYDEGNEPHIPMEVGLVWISLQHGILREFHKVINPGEPPQGNRSIAIEFAEKHHQIPIDDERGETNMKSLWQEIERFCQPDEDSIDILFCLSAHRDRVENCLYYIHDRGAPHEPDTLTKIYCVEDLVLTLLELSMALKERPAVSQIYDTLIQNRWDYTGCIRCHFHQEADTPFCSIAIVKRYSFVIFDLLANMFGCDLSPRHMPDETNGSFLLVPLGKKNEPDRRARGPRFGRSESVRAISPPQLERTATEAIERVTISLSSDSDSDELEVEISEIKSSTLRELRPPRTAPFSSHLSQSAHGLSAALPFGRGVTVALPTTSASSVTPPPGFIRAGNLVKPVAVRPGSSYSSSMKHCYSSGDMPQGHYSSRPGVDFEETSSHSFSRGDPMGRGREAFNQMVTKGLRGRGRGLPPQS